MTALTELAEAHGIGLRYHDIWGALHDVSDDALRTLLAAMDVDASTDAKASEALGEHRAARWRRRLPPMIVLREDATPRRIRLHLPMRADDADLRMRIVAESGVVHVQRLSSAEIVDNTTIDGEPWCARDIELTIPLAHGYHRVTIVDASEAVAEARVAIAPARCHRPAALRDGGRTWGLAVQLYGARSERNWGIGDYTDLAGIVTGCGERGAGIVGVNPLHALFPHNPRHISPYSPSSRLFANTLYLDVEAIADFAECASARALVAGAAFRERLAALRESALVDYEGVAAAKKEVLALLFASFCERHVARSTARAARFAAFRREAGEPLRLHALFEALQEHCFALDEAAWGWPAWPLRFRDPHARAVAQFARERAGRVDYFAWLQWQSDLQRAAVGARARDAGLCVGLYTDLAVSIDPGGAEAWAQQRLYATGASVGAPPDAFNREGQDWGLPPIVPSRLADAGYAPFLATLRANMRHAGALRIDHVMGLRRLFWVPRGGKPVDGAYVHYPLDDLVGLLALESQRNHCLVIGEDLGTVPDEVRETLRERDVLSYRVLMFERGDTGAFKPPGAYPPAALATASTHDLPTLAGWWDGRDIDVRAGIGFADDSVAAHAERARDRTRLVDALEHAGALKDQAQASRPPPAEAIAAFLGATPSAIVVLQVEDTLLVREQANLPGTTDQHPNWQRKLPVVIDEMFAREPLASIARHLSAVRACPATPEAGGL